MLLTFKNIFNGSTQIFTKSPEKKETKTYFLWTKKSAIDIFKVNFSQNQRLKGIFRNLVLENDNEDTKYCIWPAKALLPFCLDKDFHPHQEKKPKKLEQNSEH